MAEVVEDVYPKKYAAFVSTLRFVNLDIGLLLSHSCVVQIDFYDRLLLSTLTPFAVLLALAAAYSISKDRNKDSEPSRRLQVRHNYVSAVILMAFFVYSTVSFTIFQTFVCDTTGETNFLRADYSLHCDTDVYRRYRAYAAVMVCVYPIGLPAIYAWWLLRIRKELAKPSSLTETTSSLTETTELANTSVLTVTNHLERLSGIWASYRPSRYYYDLIECVRRTALTAAAVFIVPSSVSQINVGLLLAAVFSLVSASADPFTSKVDTNLSLWGNGIILASMYLALLTKVNVSDNDEVSV
ncbi:unnamed protein product, partial [Laminaria digitata]